jgi:hypothetical protein
VTLSGTGVSAVGGSTTQYTAAGRKSGTVTVNNMPSGQAYVDVTVGQTAADTNGCTANPDFAVSTGRHDR